jgi:hypothetical protein
MAEQSQEHRADQQGHSQRTETAKMAQPAPNRQEEVLRKYAHQDPPATNPDPPMPYVLPQNTKPINPPAPMTPQGGDSGGSSPTQPPAQGN